MSATREDHPPSPCIDDCVMDPDTGYCSGCFREIDEIVDWPVMSGEEKRRVLVAVAERRRRLTGEDE